MPNSNGASTSNGAAPGPSSSTNGHSAGGSTVKPVRLEGKLMYEDDRDWSDHQGLADLIPDDTLDEEMEDGVGGSDLIKRRKAKIGVTGGKRMPVDREEVVRLILQGLRDIGYE